MKNFVCKMIDHNYIIYQGRDRIDEYNPNKWYLYVKKAIMIYPSKVDDDEISAILEKRFKLTKEDYRIIHDDVEIITKKED